MYGNNFYFSIIHLLSYRRIAHGVRQKRKTEILNIRPDLSLFFLNFLLINDLGFAVPMYVVDHERTVGSCVLAPVALHPHVRL